MAHSALVKCLALGPSSGRVMVTGGEDRKVNMWAVGKPNVIMVCVKFYAVYIFVSLLWERCGIACTHPGTCLQLPRCAIYCTPSLP